MDGRGGLSRREIKATCFREICDTTVTAYLTDDHHDQSFYLQGFDFGKRLMFLRLSLGGNVSPFSSRHSSLAGFTPAISSVCSCVVSIPSKFLRLSRWLFWWERIILAGGIVGLCWLPLL